MEGRTDWCGLQTWQLLVPPEKGVVVYKTNRNLETPQIQVINSWGSNSNQKERMGLFVILLFVSFHFFSSIRSIWKPTHKARRRFLKTNLYPEAICHPLDLWKLLFPNAAAQVPAAPCWLPLLQSSLEIRSGPTRLIVFHTNGRLERDQPAMISFKFSGNTNKWKIKELAFAGGVPIGGPGILACACLPSQSDFCRIHSSVSLFRETDVKNSRLSLL